jgi:membrane protein implicated in regulation of membrane protease activity
MLEGRREAGKAQREHYQSSRATAILLGMLLALSIAGLFVLPSPWNVIGVCVAAVIEVAELAFWRRFLRRYRIRVGPELIVGETAEVITPCAPEGQVRLNGEIWRARCSAPVARGALVRVVRVEGLTLGVEPVDSDSL